MSIVKSTVFDRDGDDSMSRNAFYFVMCVVLAWGLTGTYILSSMTAAWHPSIWEMLLWGLGLPLIGIFLSVKSNNPVVSFIGFNCVALPMGAILGPALATYKLAYPGLVTEAAMITGATTATMAASGLLFPDFYKSIGGALFTALLSLLVVRVLGIFIPALQNFSVIDYIGAGIFALYIGFDMWRASTIPATIDNAIDVAVSIYLDVINLFVHVVRILANSKK